ncbi:MAG TPA: ABC transporter permease [Streptosporangiaceae bacterium]|nr:ABC transporter permease [Streptosporangiaceae bacterium]
MRFIARRLGFYIVAAWAAITMNFFIPRLMPGNPVELLIARLQGRITPQGVHAIAVAYGLETKASLLSQYGAYWVHLFQGNFGLSITYYPTPVTSVIATALPWTLVLVGLSTIIAFVIGTLLGVLAAWRRGSWLETAVPATTFFQAVPYFWIGLLAITVFGVALGWFPSSGGYAQGMTISLSGAFIGSAVYHAVLPAFTIVVTSMAGWLIGMRNMMVTTLGEDYVLTAQAKGLAERRVMLTYAARNAILPNIASFALALSFVVSGSILVEVVFSYPGIGYVLFQAVENEDYPLMEGIFLIITLAVLLANLLADMLYIVLDPRTRQEG